MSDLSDVYVCPICFTLKARHLHRHKWCQDDEDGHEDNSSTDGHDEGEQSLSSNDEKNTSNSSGEAIHVKHTDHTNNAIQAVEADVEKGISAAAELDPMDVLFALGSRRDAAIGCETSLAALKRHLRA